MVINPLNLNKPCKDCPFLKDSSTNKTLRPGRLKEIVGELEKSKTFTCHKTIDYSDDDFVFNTDTHKFCAGAMLYVHKYNIPHTLLQVMERLGGYDPKRLIGIDKIINKEDL